MPLWHYIYVIQSIIAYTAFLPCPSLNHNKAVWKEKFRMSTPLMTIMALHLKEKYYFQYKQQVINLIGSNLTNIAENRAKSVKDGLRSRNKANRQINRPGMSRGAPNETHEPKGAQTKLGASKVLGSEPKAKRPEKEKR